MQPEDTAYEVHNVSDAYAEKGELIKEQNSIS